VARLTLDTFAPHRGATFRLSAPAAAACNVVLEQAEDLSARDPGRPGSLPSPFSLLFRLPSGIDLPQGTYELTREGFDPIALFLVPIVTVDLAKGRLLEATFN